MTKESPGCPDCRGQFGDAMHGECGQTGQDAGQVVTNWDFGRRIFPAEVTTDRMMGYGPIALHVAGSAEVRFKDVSMRDLNRQIEPAEKVSSHFRTQRIDDFFYSWGATTGDINHDGVPDVIAGPFYFLGPDYTERHAFTSARTYSPAANFPQGMVYFGYDFTGDGCTSNTYAHIRNTDGCERK